VKFGRPSRRQWRIYLAGTLGLGLALGLATLTTFGESRISPASGGATHQMIHARAPMAARSSLRVRNSGPRVLDAPGRFPAADGARLARLSGAYGKLPMSFEANQGQTDAQVKFLSRGRGYTLFLTANEAVLTVQESKAKSKKQRAKSKNDDPSPSVARTSNPESLISSPEPRRGEPPSSMAARAPTVLRMKLVGANPAPQVAGLEELPGKSNYFIGNNPKQWQTNVPHYAKVRYKSVYPGVELVYYGNPARAGQLEYDFVVAAGADPKVIRLAFDGLVGEDLYGPPDTREHHKGAPLQINAQGDLVLQTEGGELRFRKPVVYQPVAALGVYPPGREPQPGTAVRDPRYNAADNPKSKIANRKFLDARYILKGNREVAFQVGTYDTTKPLILDPVLSYATYLGGSGDDAGNGIAVDASGNAYVTGSTGSTKFPTQPTTPLQAAAGGGEDVFVAKLNAAGTALVYSTYLGGTADDHGAGIAVDSSGNAYVTGDTASSNFPTTSSALQKTYGGGQADAFVAELKPDGSALVYATYLGGSGADYGHGIALDSAGSAYVTGGTESTDFPTTLNPIQAASGGSSDAFVAKLKPDGSAPLVYSTYLGGGDADSGQGIALDSLGNAYVTGITYSTNFPAANPWQAASGGSSDAFVAKVNTAGSGLTYSTYLGGGGFDRGMAIAVDSAGNAYVTGDTTSADFPTTAGVFQDSLHGLSDAFVTKLNPDGSLAYSTYLGGVDTERGNSIAVDSGGDAYVVGYTGSDDFPTLNAIQSTIGGGTCGASPCFDAFVTEMNPTGSGLVYSTFLGGSDADAGQAIALDSSASAYLTGQAASTNLPVTVGVFQAAYGGSGSSSDAFIAKISPANAPGVSLLPQKLAFADQAAGTTSSPQTLALINSGSEALSISSIAASGDFAQSNTCGVSLAPGGTSCTISVTFSPQATGDETGALTITDDAAGSPQVVPLTGKGVTPAPAVTLSPTSLTFADRTVGTSSDPQTVTVTNSGSATLTISSVAVTGDFTYTNDCTNASLAPGASCTISVIFTPTSSGTLSGTLTVTDNASPTTQSAQLTGNGLAVFSLSATSTSLTVNKTAASATFTISAAAPSSFTEAITLSCSSTVSPATCAFNPTSIKPGETSTLTVSNLSTVTGSSLSFTAIGTSGSQTTSVALTVLLGEFRVSASPPIVTVNAGDPAAYTVTVTPVNGFNQGVTLSCHSVVVSGDTPTLPQESTCNVSPTSVTPGGTGAVTATLSITTTKRSLAPPGDGWPWVTPSSKWLLGFPWGTAAWIITLALIVGLSAIRGRRRVYLGLIVVLVSVAAWSGCNEYYYTDIRKAANIKGTLVGNYTIEVDGTAGTLMQATMVRLAVK